MGVEHLHHPCVDRPRVYAQHCHGHVVVQHAHAPRALKHGRVTLRAHVSTVEVEDLKAVIYIPIPSLALSNWWSFVSSWRRVLFTEAQVTREKEMGFIKKRQNDWVLGLDERGELVDVLEVVFGVQAEQAGAGQSNVEERFIRPISVGFHRTSMWWSMPMAMNTER